MSQRIARKRDVEWIRSCLFSCKLRQLLSPTAKPTIRTAKDKPYYSDLDAVPVRGWRLRIAWRSTDREAPDGLEPWLNVCVDGKPV